MLLLCGQGGAALGGCYSLEEILLAVDAAGPGEAALGQLHVAVGALEAGAVPVAVQHLEDELVQDVLVAAGALGDLCPERMERRAASATATPRGSQNPARPHPGGFWGCQPSNPRTSPPAKLCQKPPGQPIPAGSDRHTRGVFPSCTPFVRPCPALCHAFSLPASPPLWNGTIIKQGQRLLLPLTHTCGSRWIWGEKNKRKNV